MLRRLKSLDGISLAAYDYKPIINTISNTGMKMNNASSVSVVMSHATGFHGRIFDEGKHI